MPATHDAGFGVRPLGQVAGSAAVILISFCPHALAFEWTVPASFHRLAIASINEQHDFLGLQVPVAWFGGPLGPFAFHIAAGYAYQRETGLGDNLNFVTVEAALDFEFPIPLIIPYLGVAAMGWYPLNRVRYFQGIPLMAAPHAGIRFSLFEIVTFDLSAFGLPGVANLWNLTDGSGKPYTGTSWGAGGRLTLNI